MKTSQIRSVFLDYFKKNGHEIVSSSPLVPKNDPTLMFTNAGMVQFKNIFTGVETPKYLRASTSQKCVRAGGKHNDLENVGYTARHHTFFEMLGNFSFGDYFKEGAIELAWNLITKEYGISKDKLLVTVYSEDEEAAVFWKKIAGLHDDKIIRIPTMDNFWMMGDTGPCGPCSEIFYDHGADIPGGPPGSPDQDGDRFIEIWNLVFMQFEQLAPGVGNEPPKRIPLPKPAIDTGMGLERITAVLQGVHDNYDIDLFRELIQTSQFMTKTENRPEMTVSHRVIADHLRASCFLIADGVLPSNEGRGYVLRRIMRRAMRHVHKLGYHHSLLWQLVPGLIVLMGDAYPELKRAESLITETLRFEEDRFRQTLDRGMKLLNEASASMTPGGVLPGEVAFKLYDTYGFPLDLTQDIMRGEKRSVDVDAFNVAMEQQRKDARANWTGSGEAKTESLWFDIREKLGATEFLGYDANHSEAKVLTVIHDGKVVSSASTGQQVMFITNQTPFYGESGGQEGDQGTALIKNKRGECVIHIHDTLKKLGDLHVHVGMIQSGDIHENDDIELTVDTDRRSLLRAHHSATHLLHAALRQRLGDHVTQKGSLVSGDKLRFDFSHNKALNAEDVHFIEQMVNREIRENTDITTLISSPEQAMEQGAMALFGEKYGDQVRVVRMGKNTSDHHFSVELCGGTHARRTGDIGLFKIITETSVAAGVRRIEAVCGPMAEKIVSDYETTLMALSQALKCSPEVVVDRVKAIQSNVRQLEKDMQFLRLKSAQMSSHSGSDESDAGVKIIKAGSFIWRHLKDISVNEMRSIADELKKTISSGVIAIASEQEDRVSLIVSVTADITDQVNAVDLVRVGSDILGGKGGGGRPDFAQGGGPHIHAIAQVQEKIQALLS